MTPTEKYKDCLEYIDTYWDKTIYPPSRMRLRYKYFNIPHVLLKGNNKNSNFIYIPHSYFVPNNKKHNHIFYWDSFFMFKGLMGTKRQRLMKEMVNNFIYLFDKYQIIPNFNAPASINRSQPPFLSSMILDTYLTPLYVNSSQKYIQDVSRRMYKIKNIIWFKNSISTAKKEYNLVWIDKENLYNHHVKGFGLSRYGDRDIGYAHSSELESGWDMTSRFYNRCDQFLPIDLNVYLYKYELDFAKAAHILGEKNEEQKWTEMAEKRKKEINKYMWNPEENFFFDYGYVFKQVSHYFSLASYTPMWAGLATVDQAKYMVKRLSKFETPYGLTISARESLARPIELSKIQRRFHPAINEIIQPKQWDYPNIWSPLEYLTVIGLLKYGYINEAKRIMKNSLKAHADLFSKHKTFFEKINGETGQTGAGALYGDQDGFGWTNAIFYRYVHLLDAIDSKESIYLQPQPQTPPYELAILH